MICSALLYTLAAAPAFAQTPAGTAFTYQGRLTENGVPANGAYDLRFRMFDTATGGTPIGAEWLVGASQVSEGLITTIVDFGSDAITGAARWMEIAVRDAGAVQYVTLSPRQPIMPAPCTQIALNTAQWKTVNGCVTNAQTGQFVGVRRATPINSTEVFGIQAPATSSYGGMYVRTDGVSGVPFYGYSNGVQSAWTSFDGEIGSWHVNNGANHLTVTDTGRVGIGTISPAARLDISGSGQPDALFATNTGAGRAAHFHMPAGSSGNALYGVTYGTGRAATFESHAVNSTPAVTVVKNAGTAIKSNGDIEVDGALRGKCGNSVARLTSIANARFRNVGGPLTLQSASPNVQVVSAAGYTQVWIDDDAPPSSWIILATNSFEYPTTPGTYDDLEIHVTDNDEQKIIWLRAECYDWHTDPASCFEGDPAPGEVHVNLVVYRP